MSSREKEELENKITEILYYDANNDTWTPPEDLAKRIVKMLTIEKRLANIGYCANERLDRKVICQLPRGHKGSHQAVIYWEDEK